jgi:CheY-like chemotaxis protein
MRINMRNPENSDFSIITLDDDPIMTATIQTYFQNAGYMVDAENDPHLAIERIRNGNYDILLLDFLCHPCLEMRLSKRFVNLIKISLSFY